MSAPAASSASLSFNPKWRYSLVDFVERAASNCPEKPALIMDGKEITYSEWLLRAKKLASTLQEKYGVKAQEFVGICTPNCLELLVLMLALDIIGAIPSGLPHMLSSEEFGNVINAYRCRLLFLHSTTQEKYDAMESKIEVKPQIFRIGDGVADGKGDEGMPSVSSLVFEGKEDGYTRPDLTEESIAVVMLTSGTTGTPKRVPITYRCLFAFIYSFPIPPGPVILYNSFAWIGANAGLWGIVNAMGTLVLMAGYEKEKYLKLVLEVKCPFLGLLPRCFQDFTEIKDPKTLEILKNQIRAVICGGGTIPANSIEKMLSLYPHAIITNGYGMSEVNGCTRMVITKDMLCEEKRHLLASIGKPNVGIRLKVADDDGKELPVGETGEILVTTAVMFPGYLDNPEASKAVFCDGWYRTGDIGLKDAEGYYYLKDRKKDIVKTPEGYNIFPIEIETVLAKHPNVVNVAGVGIKTKDGSGELTIACVIAKEKGDDKAKELLDLCAEKLAAYKVPKKVVFFDEFSFNRNDKVDKNAMRKRLAGVEEEFA